MLGRVINVPLDDIDHVLIHIEERCGSLFVKRLLECTYLMAYFARLFSFHILKSCLKIVLLRASNYEMAYFIFINFHGA